MRSQSPSYRIVEYDTRWPTFFEEERARVACVLEAGSWYIEHVGSTSVPGLGAKPIIDLMVGIPTMSAAQGYVQRLETIGYEWRGETVPGTLYIRKEAPQRYNLHLTEYGGAFWAEHLMFRDYLRQHADVVRQYEELKRELMSRLADDPPVYNDGKSAFIQDMVERARLEFDR